MKLTLRAIGSIAVVTGMIMLSGACKKKHAEPITTAPLTSGGATTVHTISPCGDPVVSNLIAGQNMTSGSITVQNDADSVYVTFATTNGWVLGKTHLYVGDLAGVPTTQSGNPQIGNFPYQHTFSPYVTSDTYAIAIADLPPCFIVAAHAETHLLDANGNVIQTETSWGQGTQFNSSGSWAMYSEYCVQECNPCQITTQVYDLFAGQTIDVGQLQVTNDDQNLYITYQTTGDWYVGKVHVYVGDLSGLPVNGQNVPVPGQFPYSETYNPYTQSATVTVPLAGLPSCYVIAAHAEVHKVVNGTEVQSETAWSFGTPFANTDRWGWTSDYCTQLCN